MLVGGQNAVRAYRKSWPIVPGLHDPERPIAQVRALEHWEKDLALYLDAHPGFLDCGTDPLPDGNMEAAGTGAYVPTTVVLSKSLVNPHSGLQSLQLDFNGASALGQASCAGFTAGQTYRVVLWYYSDGTSQFHLTDGAAVVGVYPAVLGWNRVLYQGVWGGVVLGLRCPNLAAGVFLRIDDITATPLNVTTWADRTRRGGRNPTQAVAASRPYVENSPTNGRVTVHFTGDTVRTWLASTYPYVQPEHCLIVTRCDTSDATVRAVRDGNASSLALVFFVAPNMGMYAGTGLSPLVAAGTGNYLIDSLFNGAASTICPNLGATTVGDPGAANAGGISLGSVNGAGGPYPYHGSTQTVLDLSRPFSESERFNIGRAMMRRACI